MNYYQFNAEDLAADDYFKEWVCTPTAETEAFWADFLKDYPERYYQVEEARRLVVGLEAIQEPERPQTEAVEIIWDRIQTTLRRPEPVFVRRTVNRWYALAVVASVLLLLGAGWLFRGRPDSPLSGLARGNDSTGWIETVNEASEVMQVQLPDGSRADLQQGSHLRYRRAMSGPVREVTLVGDAFFSVRKNPQKPFVVYANGLITRVLGTSFRVKALPDSPTVTVSVRTGRVSVYPHQSDKEKDPESKGVVLTPNQEVIFQRDIITLNKTLVGHPRIILPPAAMVLFEFDDAPVADVFDAIEKAYGVDVIYDEELMQHCSLTLSLDQEDLFQKLDVICKVLNANYKVINAQVVIYSKGCSEPVNP